MRAGTRPGGYTFLELALVLGVVVIVFISVVPVLAANQTERRLRQAMDDLAQAVRERRADAERTGADQPLWVTKTGLFERRGGTTRELARPPARAELFVRFPAGDWRQDQEWRVPSGGFVEPASLRIREGRAWIEADFDFLTGSIAEERYSF